MTRAAAILVACGLTACAGNATHEIQENDRAQAIQADLITPRCADASACAALWERAIIWAAERPDRQVLTIKREKGRFLLVRGNGTALDVQLKRAIDGSGWLQTDIVCTQLWESACTPVANAARLEFNKAMAP